MSRGGPVQNWAIIRHFKSYEFQDPDEPDSGLLADHVLVTILDEVRDRTGWPVRTHWEVGGAVDVHGTHAHSRNSYHLKKNGCKALDFHFETTADTREQFRQVERAGFTGIGIYYHWKWNNSLLPIAFHVDFRPVDRYQRWVERKKGQRRYLLK